MSALHFTSGGRHLPPSASGTVLARCTSWLAVFVVGLACSPEAPLPEGRCLTRADCLEGQVCLLSACVEAPPDDKDAGLVDAAVPDAAEHADAGPSDSGLPDAAVPLDAGPSDAGHVDAGRSDAGLSGDAALPPEEDGGSADGGFEVDSGMAPDAGQLDAGLDDAGQPFRCTRPRDCLLDEFCNTVTGQCETLQCDRDDRCPDRYECDTFLERCVFAGCESDLDCAFGEERCELATGACLALLGGGCTSHFQCGVQEHCEYETGRCMPGRKCAWDANCFRNQRCGPDKVCIDIEKCGTALECDDDQECMSLTGQIDDFQCLELGAYCVIDPETGSDNCNDLSLRCDPIANRCVRGGQCTGDSDCRVAEGEACDPRDKVCVFPTRPCSSPTQCRADESCHPALKKCIAKLRCHIDIEAQCEEGEVCVPGNGECVEAGLDKLCTSNEDCEEDVEVCDLGMPQPSCVAVAGAGACVTAGDCLEGELCVPREDGSSRCVPSDPPPECSATLPCDDATQVCDLEAAKCVVIATCQSDTDCLGNETCNPDTSRCEVLPEPAACGVDRPCPGEEELCDLADGTCVAIATCQSDTDCLGNETCNPETGRCEALPEPPACSETSPCEGEGQVCELQSGECITVALCQGDADCQDTEECDPETGRCLVRSADRPDGDCFQNGQGCEAGETCAFDGEKGVCVVATSGTSCQSDADCRDGAQCNRETEECVAISEDAPDSDCLDAGQGCEAGESCVFDGDKGVCVVATSGTSCQSDADCRDGTQCNREQEECVALSEEAPDSDCLSGGTQCEPGETCAFDGDKGVCVVATTGNDCQSDTDCRGASLCNPESGQCEEAQEPSGCSETEPCPNPGEVCDLENGECALTAGGTECETSLDCRANEVCSVDSDGNRFCVPVPACNVDDDCEAGRVCDALTGRCVAAETEAGCDSSAACGPGSVCRLPGGGCAPGGACGRCILASAACADDSDCGGGQICDLDTALCRNVNRCLDADQDGNPDDPSCIDLRCSADQDCPGSSKCNLCYDVCQTPVSSCGTSDDCLCGWSCDTTEGNSGVCLRGGSGATSQ